MSIVHSLYAEAVTFVLLSQCAKLPTIRHRSVESIPTLPSSGPVFRGEVELTRGGSVIGIDRGTVTFFEGWLLFEGFHTSFCLSRVDVAKRSDHRLELIEGGRVCFEPDDLKRHFSRCLDAWYCLDPSAKGVSVLPPLESNASGRAALTFAVTSGTLLTCICARSGLTFIALSALSAVSLTVAFVRKTGFRERKPPHP